MATKSIGYVVELVGDAQVRSVDGVIKVLSIGDQINEGDILTTGLNTQIVLEFYDGHKLQVGENTEMLLMSRFLLASMLTLMAAPINWLNCKA